MNFLVLIFGEFFYKLTTLIVKIVLLFKGVEVGKNFVCKGFPYLKLKSLNKSLVIKNNVTLIGKVDLRTRENGLIILDNNCIIEESRIVSALNGKVHIGEYTEVLQNSFIVGGEDIIIGKYCVIGVRNCINSSKHLVNQSVRFFEKKYIHKKVIIGDYAWTGVNTMINPGVNIGSNSIIGSNSVVTKNVEKNSVYVGVPAKKLNSI